MREISKQKINDTLTMDASGGLTASAIGGICSTIRPASDLNVLFNTLFPELSRLFDFDVAGVSLFDPQQTLIEYEQFFSREKAPGLSPLIYMGVEFEGSPLEEIKAYIHPVVRNNGYWQSRFQRYMRAHPSQAFFDHQLYVPLRHSGCMLGVIIFYSNDPFGLTPQALSLFNELSEQLAVMLKLITGDRRLQDAENEKNNLLAISNSIASVQDKEDLLNVILSQLKKLLSFDIASIHVTDPEEGSSRYLLQYVNPAIRAHAGIDGFLTSDFGVREGDPVENPDSSQPCVWSIADALREKDAPGYLQFLDENHIVKGAGISLREKNKRIATLVFFSSEADAFQKSQVRLIEDIAFQLSTAVANILANERLEARKRERDLLFALSNDLATTRDKNDLLAVIDRHLICLFPASDAAIRLIDDNHKTHSIYFVVPNPRRSHYPGYHSIIQLKSTVYDGVVDKVLAAEGPVVFDIGASVRSGSAPDYHVFIHDAGIRESVNVALRNGDKAFGIFILFSETPGAFKPAHLKLIRGIADQLSVALSNILAYQKISNQLTEIEGYKQRLQDENQYLQKEIETVYNYSEIVGSSEEMNKVFRLISQVAETDSSVLILGETGTGKELIARAIHNSSRRKDKLMVKVNCAALPANLIESELFGHERGSFTGATDRRIGKFELANKGTLFLDEIGELPLDLQVKLLRALQEKEIERVGGRTTISTDVRIIAATNRNLSKEVQAGRFRSDLFFRLDVFPITLPPLRERKDDIMHLTNHFIAKHARKSGKNVNNISVSAFNSLLAYSWPGNVRELEHLIERYILLATGPVISNVQLPVTIGTEAPHESVPSKVKTIDEVERQHIMMVLKMCKGRVAGPGGAAEMLEIPSTTLNSKIKKLGIRKEFSAD